MKRIFSFSFAFLILFGLFSFNPLIAHAATTNQIEAAETLAGSKTFIITDYKLYVYSSGTLTKDDSTLYVPGMRYEWVDEAWRYGNDKSAHPITISLISYMNRDLMNGDTVFFLKPLEPVPASLKQLARHVGSQSMIILVPAVVILASLMGVSLVSRVLYRYF